MTDRPQPDLMERMHKACKKHGYAIAAPQVGVSLCLVLLRTAWVRQSSGWAPSRDAVSGTTRETWMVNPRIVDKSETTKVGPEGCLSFPGLGKMVRRHTSITVEWLDENLKPRREVFDDFHARVVQHELDHLSGVCRVGDDSFDDIPDVTTPQGRIDAAEQAAATADPRGEQLRRLYETVYRNTKIGRVRSSDPNVYKRPEKPPKPADLGLGED